MTYLYIATRYVTFFGAILRAFWEHVACRICKIPIEDARSLRSNELCGHIEHELPENVKQSFLVCWLPFTMNFIFGCAFSLTGAYRLFFIGEKTYWPIYILVWLGLSCFANCASSFEDAIALIDGFSKKGNKIFKVIIAPFAGVNYAMALLERFSLTFVLSVILTVFFPRVFGLLFPLLDYIDQNVY